MNNKSYVDEKTIHLNIKFYKHQIKRSLLKIQSIGDIEWHAGNIPPYRIQGLRKALSREANKCICYTEY